MQMLLLLFVILYEVHIIVSECLLINNTNYASS